MRLIRDQGLAAGPEVNRQQRGEKSRPALNSRAEPGEHPARFGGRRYRRPVGPAVWQVRVTAGAGRGRMRAEAPPAEPDAVPDAGSLLAVPWPRPARSGPNQRVRLLRRISIRSSHRSGAPGSGWRRSVLTKPSRL